MNGRMERPQLMCAYIAQLNNARVQTGGRPRCGGPVQDRENAVGVLSERNEQQLSDTQSMGARHERHAQHRTPHRMAQRRCVGRCGTAVAQHRAVPTNDDSRVRAVPRHHADDRKRPQGHARDLHGPPLRAAGALDARRRADDGNALAVRTCHAAGTHTLWACRPTVKEDETRQARACRWYDR
jgi:hypothetical protein